MAATYYSPLFNNDFPLSTNKTPLDRVLATRLRGLPKRAAIMKALNGEAAGGLASAGYKRVQASQVEQGGKRVIETRAVISRNTTADDEAYIDTLLDPTSRIATPADKAGNWSF